MPPPAAQGIIDRVGAVVEHPKFLPGFTARRNLDAARRQPRGVPESRVDDVDGRVRLTAATGSATGVLPRHASTAGDRGDVAEVPELLILDEPTEGLDSTDVRFVRELVRELGASQASRFC